MTKQPTDTQNALSSRWLVASPLEAHTCCPQIYVCKETLDYLTLLSKPKVVQATGAAGDASADISMEGMQVVRKTEAVADDMFDSVKKGQKGRGKRRR